MRRKSKDGEGGRLEVRQSRLELVDETGATVAVAVASEDATRVSACIRRLGLHGGLAEDVDRMAHLVPGGVAGSAGGAGEQLSLFLTRCGTCPVSPSCGERESSTACREVAQYRRGAIHPDKIRFVSSDDQRFELRMAPAQWASSTVELPPILAVASTATVPFAPLTVIDAPTTLTLRHQASSTIACLATDDHTLERIWHRRSRLGREIRRLGIRLVIAPPFSTWWQDPPFQGLHEMARTAEVAVRLADELDTIPSICWRNDRDLSRWVEWLMPTAPQVVAVDLCTLKSRNAWSWGMRGVLHLAELSKQARTAPRLLAVGPLKVWKLIELRAAWPYALTIASRGVWQLSKAQMLLDEDGNRSKCLDLSFAELLAENVSRLETSLLRSGSTLGKSAWAFNRQRALECGGFRRARLAHESGSSLSAEGVFSRRKWGAAISYSWD